jgi:parvulin-like peptidyl-prolyl isomerase
MSIMGIRRRFARHLRILLWIILIGFVLGIFFFAFYTKGPLQTGPRGHKASAEDVFASVGGEKITRPELDKVYLFYLEQQSQHGGSVLGGLGGVRLGMVLMIRHRALQDLAASIAMAQEARRRGFEVSGDEVRAYIEQQVEAAIKGLKEQAGGRDPREIYREIMARRGIKRSRVTEKEFRRWFTTTLTESEGEQTKRTILMEKLRASVVGTAQVSDEDLSLSFDEVKITPIILQFPLSEEATEEESKAKQRAEEIHAKLSAGADFGALAKSASSEAPLRLPEGWLTREDVRGIFGEEAEKALFGLKPGQFSAPVRTPAAYIILRMEAFRRQLPEDFDEHREEYRERLIAQRQQGAWEKLNAEVLQKAEIEPVAFEAVAMKALAEGKTDEAVAALEKAFEEPAGLAGEVFSAICFELGDYYFQKKDFVRAKERFEAALSPVGDIPRGFIVGFPEDIYIALGRIALEQENTEEAVEYFTQADISDDYMVHLTLLDIYDKMGRKEDAARQETWVAEYRKLMEEESKRAMEEAARRQAAQEEASPQAAPGGQTLPPQPIPQENGAVR